MHYKAAWACGQAALRLAHMPTRRYDHHRLSPLVSTRNDEGPKYATEFHMTNDSKLFPPRQKWEAQGYQPDEYGHWLKGAWQPYAGETTILNRPKDIVLSRDGDLALQIDRIEDIALPLFQGALVNQFDWCSSVYEKGAGQRVTWRRLNDNETRYPSPQFLMSKKHFEEKGKFFTDYRFGFRGISNTTNERTFIGAAIPSMPASNMLPILFLDDALELANLCAAVNSFACDYFTRIRVSTGTGAVAMTYSSISEIPILKSQSEQIRKTIALIAASLNFIGPHFYKHWINLLTHIPEIRKRALPLWLAITPHERLRQRSILDAVVAFSLGLSHKELAFILNSCDKVAQGKAPLSDNAKGLWRVDRTKDPELRHTILSQIAFRDLHEKGIDSFLSQNNGEGWMIPAQLRLNDYGLGHDGRAKLHQPVASRLGPRLLDWQLNCEIERSWRECFTHAELIARIAPQSNSSISEDVSQLERKDAQQKGLF